MKLSELKKIQLWLKGLLAAGISGAAGGVMTGLAALGIDPQHFNLQSGAHATMRIGAAAALINSVIGVSAYLQKSPLPEDSHRDEEFPGTNRSQT
jgi:hypothetical protein